MFNEFLMPLYWKFLIDYVEIGFSRRNYRCHH